MTSQVTAAVEETSYAYFVTEPDGSKLPQSSAIAAVSETLTLLDVRPGQHVLEIGTGSGYTAALLSRLVGPQGHVHSVEVDPDLVHRARARLVEARITNVTVTHADGYAGDPDGAPYDRIAAWSTPHLVPAPWIDQATPDAVIVTPVKVAELAVANAIVTIQLADSTPTVTDVRPGSYIEMHDDVVTTFALPIRYVDASILNDTETNGAPWWLSGTHLHDDPAAAHDLLDVIAKYPTEQPSPLTADELADFTGWLYATRPHGLVTAGLPDHLLTIGAATSTGLALLGRSAAVHAGTKDARDLLHAWIAQWRGAGSSGWDGVTGTTIEDVEGWIVRLEVGR
jgi:protein-L-isoaspartate(D-aspartate) O-methyltransferase